MRDVSFASHLAMVAASEMKGRSRYRQQMNRGLFDYGKCFRGPAS